MIDGHDEDYFDQELPMLGFYREALTEAFRRSATLGTGTSFQPYSEFKHDPVGFAEHVLGWSPWQKQREIGQALVDHKRVSVVSCNGAGKTVWAARLLCWFLYTRPNAIVLTTAPTYNQVGLLWKQVQVAHLQGRRTMPGRLMATSRLELGPTWYAQGIATDREERFQGYHPENPDSGMLVIVDEASGVADYVYDAIRGYLTSDNCYVLLIGNGNRAEGQFYDSHQRGPWARFSIAAHEVPEEFMSRAWIEEQREHWGEDSPQYQVRVMGQFPKAGSDFQLIPTWMLEQAESNAPGDEAPHIGVDIARGSRDYNVAVVTRGGRVEDCLSWHEQDLMATAERIRDLASKHSVADDHIHIDATGIGAGVVDRLREAGMGVEGVEFGGKPVGDYAWLLGSDFLAANRKAELHWAGRNLLVKGYASIPEKYRTTIWKQLSWPSYAISERGAVSVEAKEKLRARFGESPDYADAWILSLSRASASRRIFVI